MFGNHQKESNNTSELKHYEIDLEIETAFLQDKMNYGRVRNSLSRYFREKYGDNHVSRVLHRLDVRKNHQLCFTKLNGNSKKRKNQPNILEKLTDVYLANEQNKIL